MPLVPVVAVAKKPASTTVDYEFLPSARDILEEILPVSARLIVNQAALKTKRAALQPLIDAFARASR